jgi:predicted RNA binding protein YcfA (HicA-like mRNA interferase family)
MPPLPSIDWSEVVAAFGRAGWQHDRTRGSHYILTRPGRPGLLSVPMHKPVRRGTLRKLIREAGLTVDEFIDLLND